MLTQSVRVRRVASAQRHYGQMGPWIQGPWKNPKYLPDGSRPEGLWLPFDSIEAGMGGPQTWARLPSYDAGATTHQARPHPSNRVGPPAAASPRLPKHA
jgi:hypothetical protein